MKEIQTYAPGYFQKRLRTSAVVAIYLWAAFSFFAPILRGIFTGLWSLF